MALSDQDVQMIRKLASEEAGRRFFEEKKELSLVDEIELKKVSSAKDPVLFGYASLLNPHDPFSMYEEMGGLYNSERVG